MDLNPSAQGEPLFAGDVVQLGDDQRLGCPVDVRRLVKWLTKGNPGPIYAELCEREHVRLWPRELIEKSLTERRKALLAVDQSEEKLRALADRYREVGLQADARVRLTEAVMLHLGIMPGQQPYLYMQGSDRLPAIDVMSLAHRDILQRRYRADTTL